MDILPINLDDLVNARSVESTRLEYKKSWTPQILDTTIRTICAFANDVQNLNGGYIIIGVEAEDGVPVLPPIGLDVKQLDHIQQEIRGNCNRIQPGYQPVLSPEIYMQRHVLVAWAPGGEVRPYQAPRGVREPQLAYYIRQGSETVEARGELLTQLMQLAARVPFDDRRNQSASEDVISPTLVRNFLSDIKSDLVALGTTYSDRELIRSLRITTPVNGHAAPKNVALLFFVHDPEQYFPGARIEVVQFADGAGGDLIEERSFRGPLHDQIRQALDYLNGFTSYLTRKAPGTAEAQRTVAFPYESMEEALVNAVYHRSYDSNPEPVKVYLYPDRMEIISYPGPVAGISRADLQPGHTVPPAPIRNRRIGEFLKELRLAEGRGTGIPKIRRRMSENGSPEPVFDFDDARSFFRVTLPAHPQFAVLSALREGGRLWAMGERSQAIEHLRSALKRASASDALAAQLIEWEGDLGNDSAAQSLFDSIASELPAPDRHLVYSAMARLLLDRGERDRAAAVLARAPRPVNSDDVLERAVLNKRAGLPNDPSSKTRSSQVKQRRSR